MNDAEKLDEIRTILEVRTSDAEKVRQIRKVLTPPAEPGEIEKDRRGWPVIPNEWTDSGSGPGYDPRD